MDDRSPCSLRRGAILKKLISYKKRLPCVPSWPPDIHKLHPRFHDIAHIDVDEVLGVDRRPVLSRPGVRHDPCLREVRLFLCHHDRVLKIPDAVNETGGLCLLARVDAAVGKLPDLVDRQLSFSRDDAEESSVDAVDHPLKYLSLLGRHRPER